MTDVSLVVYQHRWSELQVRCLTSIARHTKRLQYDVIVVQKEGNCAKNMNRGWGRAKAPYVVMLDEDVVILQDEWLETLIDVLRNDPKAGVIGCKETKLLEEADLLEAENTVQPTLLAEVRSWLPAYVTCYARERVGEFLEFDEAIPGQMGMSDLDACLQITAKGLKCLYHPGVTVYHPARDDDETRLREQRPLTRQQQEWFPEQVSYMNVKWGEHFRRSTSVLR